jgi:microcystin-dependent protein
MPLETAAYVDDLVATNPENADPVQQGADHLRLLKTVLKDSFPAIGGPVTASHTQINTAVSQAADLNTNAARKDAAGTFTALMTFGAGLNATSIKLEGNELVPPGTGALWFDAAAPDGWALADGGTLLRGENPVLFARWGTRYGAGDGVTTFGLPNMTLRFPVMAGSGLSLNTTGGTQTPTVTIGTGGAHSHTMTSAGAHAHGGATAGHALSVAQMPPHAHGGATTGAGAHAHTVGGLRGTSNFDNQAGGLGNPIGGVTVETSGVGDHVHGIYAEGGGQAHSHGITADGDHAHTIASAGGHNHSATVTAFRPPYFVVNFIVKRG